jgi:hypothetical protein
MHEYFLGLDQHVMVIPLPYRLLVSACMQFDSLSAHIKLHVLKKKTHYGKKEDSEQ